jgi:endo-alpha-1,4-polygalactosaminidase (GH114 family)
VQYDECEKFQKFIKAGKPVFHIEYPNKDDHSDGGVGTEVVNELCGKDEETNVNGFSTVLKRKNLDGWVEYCNLEVATTPLNATAARRGGTP